MNAIDARFEELAHRLESRAQAAAIGRCHRASRSAAGRHLGAARKLQRAGAASIPTSSATWNRRSPNCRGILSQPSARVAGIRGHRAAPRRHREVARRQPRVDPGGRAASCRERGPLVLRFETGRRRGRRRLPTISIARRADPALRRTQHQDLRSDPRHAAQDRRPAGLAGRAPPAGLRRAADAGGRRARWRCATRLRSTPDDDMPLMADAATRAPSQRRCATSAPVKRSPAEAAAAAAVAALDNDEAGRAAEPRGRSMFGGLSRAFAGKKERAEPAMTEPPSLPGMDAQAPTLDLDAAARSQARQPAARAGFRHARPQRDHAARARRTRRSRPSAARPTPPSPTSSPPRGAPRRRRPPKRKS